MVQPINPTDARIRQQQNVPDEVITIVNDFIIKRSASNHIVIEQAEVIEALTALGFERNQIFNAHMLDFENLFMSAGWNVEYDRPGYNETYKPRWVFNIK